MTPFHRPFIVDVEASGFGPESYPIEIGLALDGDRRYCSLIEPHPAWTHWDQRAQQVHRISRKMLTRHGKPLARVAHDLNHLLKNGVVYSDGWVVDKPWISRLFNQAGLARTFSVSPLERIMSQTQMELWHQTKDRVIQSLGLTRHRASTDAFIIQETYAKTRSMAH